MSRSHSSHAGARSRETAQHSTDSTTSLADQGKAHHFSCQIFGRIRTSHRLINVLQDNEPSEHDRMVVDFFSEENRESVAREEDHLAINESLVDSMQKVLGVEHGAIVEVLAMKR